MTRYDERGRKVTTHEGFTGYVSAEVKEYFEEQYLGQEIRVVPGHWPSMETKEDVDNWINFLKTMGEITKEFRKGKEPVK